MDDHSNTSNESLGAGRTTLRQSLDQIEADVRTALRDAGLSYPVHVRVPHSGDSLATMITSVDPPKDDWEKAIEIFLKVIRDHLGEVRLRSRDRKFRHECRRRDL
jgi:hypothetical protein